MKLTAVHVTIIAVALIAGISVAVGLGRAPATVLIGAATVFFAWLTHSPLPPLPPLPPPPPPAPGLPPDVFVIQPDTEKK